LCSGRRSLFEYRIWPQETIILARIEPVAYDEHLFRPMLHGVTMCHAANKPR
jgi:hypothetical protein